MRSREGQNVDESSQRRDERAPVGISGGDLLPPEPDFVKVEKNLASLGFFTPSSKRIRNEKAKTVTLTRIVDGKRIEAKATIAPSALYGLPITADQDKYLALQKIISDVVRERGRIDNPVGFTSAQLLLTLHRYRDSGWNYKEIEEWLKVMTSTTIISEGTVYHATKKTWAKDVFHVFDRVILFGQEIEPGLAADKNYVFLSDWQLENMNGNHLLPLDLDTYQRLTTHIARVLVPLLQIWLYATREEGRFEKLYEELCQTLNIRQYRHPSWIKQKLGPALDELRHHGYLADWRIERTVDRQRYKLVFIHGEKFHRDRNRRLRKKENTLKTTPPVVSEPEGDLLHEFVRRGISENRGRRLMQTASDHNRVLDQLAWGDFVIGNAAKDKFTNPAGFYISLIRDDITPPAGFESPRTLKMRRERQERTKLDAQVKNEVQREYGLYRARKSELWISARGTAEQFEQLVLQKRKVLLRRHKYLATWKAETLLSMASRDVRNDLLHDIELLDFEAFCKVRAKAGLKNHLPGDDDRHGGQGGLSPSGGERGGESISPPNTSL